MTKLGELIFPTEEFIRSEFDNFLNELKTKFNFDTAIFENLFTSEKPIEDVYFDYEIPNVGEFNFKILDGEVVSTGVTEFRPIVRAFIMLMIFLYNIRQLIGFFGFDAGVVAGRGEHIKSMKEKQGDD